MIDEHWGDSVLVWNGVVASVPGLVFRPATSTELEAAVAFAREHGLRVSVRRGRDGAGAASERRLTLDLTGHHVSE
jgi:FAD/FMN-containing dehydrogenase